MQFCFDRDDVVGAATVYDYTELNDFNMAAATKRVSQVRLRQIAAHNS